jgi:hypothetical protein
VDPTTPNDSVVRFWQRAGLERCTDECFDKHEAQTNTHRSQRVSGCAIRSIAESVFHRLVHDVPWQEQEGGWGGLRHLQRFWSCILASDMMFHFNARGKNISVFSDSQVWKTCETGILPRM